MKELEYRLMQDERFLQEVRSSFCVSNWPETRIAEMLKFIGKALTTIDNLLVRSLSKSISPFFSVQN